MARSIKPGSGGGRYSTSGVQELERVTGRVISYRKRGYSANGIGVVDINNVGKREIGFDAQLQIKPGDVVSFTLIKDRRSVPGAKAVNVEFR